MTLLMTAVKEMYVRFWCKERKLGTEESFARLMKWRFVLTEILMRK